MSKKPPTLAAQFLARFAGLSRGHGRFTPNGKRDKRGKVEGRFEWVKTGGATELDWAAHLAGKRGLGIPPLRDDGTARWGSIDVDTYPVKWPLLEARVAKLKLPLVLCETKSGGAHAYLFLSEAVSAPEVRTTLAAWARALGCKPDTEIFPKQDVLTGPKDWGSWLNMPYYGKERRAHDAGRRLSAEAFLALAEQRAVTAAQLAAIVVPSANGKPPASAGKTVKTKPLPAFHAGRNISLTPLAASNRRKGASYEAALAACLAENQVQAKALATDPLPEKEVEQCVQKTYRRLPNTEGDALTDLNEQYALVLVGGRAGVLRMKPFEERGELQLLGLDAFKAYTANDFFPDFKDGHGKLRSGANKGQWWLKHPERRTYEEIVFNPRSTPAGALNLWQGLALVPDPKPHPERRCARFLAHIRDHLAQGDPQLYDKIVGWFAQMIQEPWRKLGTSLVLRGKQGVGKTIVAAVLGFLLGRHYLSVSKRRELTGQFNGHLANVLLLVSEEAFWSGDHEAEGIIKDYITNPIQTIEFKAKEPIRVANYGRLLIIGNTEWLVPAAFEERRFIVVDVINPDHRQDKEYFGALQAELDGGGYAALLAHLQQCDWRQGKPEEVPQTAALQEQKENRLEREVAFLYELADAGTLPTDYDGIGQMAHEAFNRVWVEYANRHSKGMIPPLNIVTRRLNKFLTEHGCAPLGRRQRYNLDYYEFPELDEVRAAFNQALERPQDSWGRESRDVGRWWPAPPPPEKKEKEDL